MFFTKPIPDIDTLRTALEEGLSWLLPQLSDAHMPRNVKGESLPLRIDQIATFDFADGFATPFVQQKADGFHYIIEERGTEYEHHVCDAEELLCRLFTVLTFSLAASYEARTRVEGEDNRRRFFAEHLRLLSLLSSDWAAARKADLDIVLREHPFSDGG